MRALIFRFTCCPISLSFLPFYRYEINVYTLLLRTFFLQVNETNEVALMENIPNVRSRTDNLISYVSVRSYILLSFKPKPLQVPDA
jgi:hypothetical protein